MQPGEEATVSRLAVQVFDELCSAVSRDHDSAVREVTVHATPNSLGAYERLGFGARGPAETVRGIRFTPMVLARRGEWAKVASIITL